MKIRIKQRILAARFLVGFVVIVNLQCAFVFIFNPQGFTPMYELIGVPGTAAIQGFGVLFMMWNIPYIFTLANPVKFHISHYEAIIMQTIGLVGESLIYFDLTANFGMLRTSILRFIIFDGAGLVALVVAAWLTHPVITSKVNRIQKETSKI